MSLSPQQKAFADFYIESGNATKSAKKAGYSERSAYSQGQRLLKHAEVSAYIAEKLNEIGNDRAANIEEVIMFYTNVMRGKVKDQFDLDSSLMARLRAADSLMKRFTAINPPFARDKQMTALDIALGEECMRLAAEMEKKKLENQDENDKEQL